MNGYPRDPSMTVAAVTFVIGSAGLAAAAALMVSMVV